MSYEGTFFFSGLLTDTSAKLWVVARYIESISIFIYLIILEYKRNINFNLLINISFILSFFLLVDIFKYKLIFPVCYYEITGLTDFKIISECFIIVLLLFSIIFILRNKGHLAKKLKEYLLFSLIFTIAAEICFTLYDNPTGFANYLGHLFKFFSFIFIYEALIKETLRKPYNNLFQQYSNSHNKLIASASFLSTMIHDLKNPLANIRALSQLGKISKSDEKKKEYYYKIMTNVDQLNEMLNKIMGTISSEEFVECNLASVVEEVVEEIDPVCRANQIKMHYHYNKEISLSLEKSMFKRALYNIMKNAVNAMNSGGRLDIDINNNSKKVLITIKDNGPGISDSIRDKVFYPFETTDGTGLGLYMVNYTIRDIHKGRVWFDTETGKGTTFYIELPLKSETVFSISKLTLKKTGKSLNLF